MRMLPPGLDDPEQRDAHRPLLVDCRRPSCPARRGDRCTTPVGAHARYHRERWADTNHFADAELIAEYAKLDVDLGQRRAELDKISRQPLPSEVLAARAAFQEAWDRAGRDQADWERAARQRCTNPYLHSDGCRCRTEPRPVMPGGKIVNSVARGQGGAQ